MSYDPVDPREAQACAATLLGQVAGAERAGHRRLAAAADHFHLEDDSRIDDRTAAALDRAMRATVAAADAGIRDHAARLLTTRGEPALAQALRDAPGVYDRAARAGLFRDPALFGELFARERLAAIAQALPVVAADGADRPTLIARMAQSGDRLVAAAAVAMLAAHARRGAAGFGEVAAVDLARPLHQRVAWWVAAALREVAGTDEAVVVLDAALTESVRRSIDPQAELVPLEAAAMRLAQAIDAQPAELPALLAESIGDGRLVLFAALIARSGGLAFDRVRDLVIDRDSTRLWVALRALDIDRATIARIGFALGEAEPGRDVDAFADRIDTIMAVTPGAARAALAPVALDPDYHAAMLALGAHA